jgi:hypothetical protein
MNQQKMKQKSLSDLSENETSCFKFIAVPLSPSFDLYPLKNKNTQETYKHIETHTHAHIQRKR